MYVFNMFSNKRITQLIATHNLTYTNLCQKDTYMRGDIYYPQINQVTNQGYMGIDKDYFKGKYVTYAALPKAIDQACRRQKETCTGQSGYTGISKTSRCRLWKNIAYHTV